MAEITVKGYINNPRQRESTKGGYCTYSLAERQKQKDGTFEKVYYDVVDFKNPSPPPESAFVTLKGWLNVKNFIKKDGTKGIGLNVNAQELEVWPAREGTAAAAASTPADPWDDIPAPGPKNA